LGGERYCTQFSLSSSSARPIPKNVAESYSHLQNTESLGRCKKKIIEEAKKIAQRATEPLATCALKCRH